MVLATGVLKKKNSIRCSRHHKNLGLTFTILSTIPDTFGYYGSIGICDTSPASHNWVTSAWVSSLKAWELSLGCAWTWRKKWVFTVFCFLYIVYYCSCILSLPHFPPRWEWSTFCHGIVGYPWNPMILQHLPTCRLLGLVDVNVPGDCRWLTVHHWREKWKWKLKC